MKQLLLIALLLLGNNVLADENGKPIITPMSCGSSIFSAADKLCNLFKDLGGADLCKVTVDQCVEGRQQIFTGNQIELASPTNIKAWTGFGGLGLSYLAANLCLLRDIKDGSLKSEAAAVTPIGKVTVKQDVSFYSFDKQKYEWVGYHSAKACVPVFGCLDIFNQKITAKAINVDMRNSGKKAGEYKILSAHALDVKADGILQNLKVTIPAIQVKTPYGQVNAKPEFSFNRALGFQLAPYNKNNIKSMYESHHWGKAKMLDLYGVNPGSMMTGVYPFYYATGSGVFDNRRIGYHSQVAFGSRDANPKKAVWTPPATIEYPSRPDADLKAARSTLEKTPNAYIGASVEVSYSPTDLLPAAIRNNSFIGINFRVYATPLIDAALTSQFQLRNSEIAVAKKLVAPAGPVDNRPMFMEQYKELAMSGGTSAAGRFSLTAGVDLKLHLFVPLPFPLKDIDINLINIHPKTTVLEVIDVNYGKGNRSAQAASQSAKILTSGKFYQTYRSFNGYNGDGSAHIKACLAAPNAQGNLPEKPAYTPGNPEDLTKDILYPCNICVGMNTYSYVDQNRKTNVINGFLNVLFPVTQNNKPANTRWTCDQVMESGCHDMCRYDTVTGKLTVVKTAKELRASGGVSSGPARCH